MSPDQLERTLKDLPRLGTLVKDRPYRQVWRFEIDSKGYFLKFYPREGSRRKRAIRGNPAMREFLRMQWLQKAKIPSPRAVAVLSGFVLKGAKGDAVLSEAIEPAVTLDKYLNDFELRGQHAPDHLALAKQVRELVHKLGREVYGHDDLHLGNFLRHQDGTVYLLDAYAVTRGGLRMKQILRLGHSVMRYATRQDLRRAWDLLAPGARLPPANVMSPRLWRKALALSRGDNRYVKDIRAGEWAGLFFAHCKYPFRWAPASRLDVDEKDWQREWPPLLQRLQEGVLELLKTSRSGEVWAGEVTLAGHPVEVIVKRPRRKRWYRYVNEIGRGSRARRAWKKAWALVARDLPTAWPLLVMERRVLGYVVDQVIVFERVPGTPLSDVDLDGLGPDARDRLFRRAGHTLRKLERTGLVHFDPKATNWIVRLDQAVGPTPVLVDVDGVRFYRWDVFGIRRLLRSMRDHPQYTPPDSLALCQGYAPFKWMEPEDAGERAEEEPADEDGR